MKGHQRNGKNKIKNEYIKTIKKRMKKGKLDEKEWESEYRG